MSPDSKRNQHLGSTQGRVEEGTGRRSLRLPPAIGHTKQVDALLQNTQD